MSKKVNHEFTLGEALNQAIAAAPIRDKWNAQRIVDNWAEVAGTAVARHTEKVWIRKGVLYVKVNGPAWKNELLYARSEIARQVNEQAGMELVQDVRIL